MEPKSGGILAACVWVLLAIPAPAHAQTIEFGKRGLPNIPVTNPILPGVVELSFTLKQGGPVNLSVYDVAGRLVTKLVDGSMAAGSHSVQWNRAGASGSGLYFARLRTIQGDQTLKLLVMGQ